MISHQYCICIYLKGMGNKHTNILEMCFWENADQSWKSSELFWSPGVQKINFLMCKYLFFNVNLHIHTHTLGSCNNMYILKWYYVNDNGILPTGIYSIDILKI